LDGRRREINQAWMGRGQGAIGESHALMPFGNIILVGSLMRIQIPGLFLFMILIAILMMILFMILLMIRMSGPEIPGMGMGRFRMGAALVLIGMGMEKKERREGEKAIGGQHEAVKALAFRSRNEPMEG
jgi:hypothetical protein